MVAMLDRDVLRCWRLRLSRDNKMIEGATISRCNILNKLGPSERGEGGPSFQSKTVACAMSTRNATTGVRTRLM